MAFLPEYIPIALYIIVAVFLTGITLYTIQRRNDKKALFFSIGLIFQIIWILSFVFLILSPNRDHKLLFDQFITIASYYVATSYFLFAMEYNGITFQKYKKFFIIVLIYGFLLLLPVLIFPEAEWMRTDVRSDGVYSIIRYGNGIYLNILIGESYFKLLLTFALFIRNLFLKTRSRLVKQQSIVIIISYLLLFFSSIVSIWSGDLGIVDYFVSYYLIGIILASIFIFIAVFPLRTFELLPAAQNLILNNIGEGYCVFNEKNELLEINEELMRILGVVDKSTILGKTPRQLFTQHTNLMMLALTPENTSIEVKFLLRGKNCYYDISKRIIYRRKRKLGYTLIYHDISERKEYERNLEASKDELEKKFQHAQKMDSIGQLAGGISHEFNNILTIILGNAELLEENLKSDYDSSILLGELSDAAKNASQMTKRLLTFSRKNIIHPTVVDINLFEKMKSQYQRLIGKDFDIHINTNLHPNIGNIFIDVGLMEQILFNLVVNARDAMPTGGNLEISTKPFTISPEITHKFPEAEQSDYICIQVTDTGIGMTDEVKNHLFEPFYTTKPKGKGTGLGLSMVYGAVKQFNGFTEVSTAPGVGSSFKIYIPTINEEVTVSISKKSDYLLRGNNELIIIVEDEDSVRNITHKMISKLGYQVLSFESGKNALEALKSGKNEIGLLFTDVMMPGLKGNEVFSELNKYYPELKVLYASGYTDNIIAQYGVLFKDTNFIAKPFTIESLAKKLYKILHG